MVYEVLVSGKNSIGMFFLSDQHSDFKSHSLSVILMKLLFTVEL